MHYQIKIVLIIRQRVDNCIKQIGHDRVQSPDPAKNGLDLDPYS